MYWRIYIVISLLLSFVLICYAFFSHPPQIKKKNWYYIWLILLSIIIISILILIFTKVNSGFSTIIGTIFIYILIFSFFYAIIHLVGWFFKKENRLKIQKYAFNFAFVILIIAVIGNLFYSNRVVLKNYNLYYENLPESFDGYTIAQISDLHLGSFINDHKLKIAADKINKLQPDIIIFTGDLVNSSMKEIKPEYVKQLKNMHAPIKLAILGNHDYHDFHKFSHYWGNKPLEPKIALSDSITLILEQCGFTVLRDSIYYVKKNFDSIAFVGLNNYGEPPFTVFGNIYKVLDKAPKNLFSIILVHDPFYWSEGLFDEFPLTLSGHTHGGQFGFFINEQLRLSLASINGKTGGLYPNGNKNNLIINTGLGHVGVNFHLGFSSQIAVIKLHKK